MLVLSRKAGQAVRIGSEVRIRVQSLSGGQVRLAIEAPDDVTVHREEIFDRIVRANRSSASDAAGGEMSERVVIASRRFGHIETESSDLIHFDGLPGFPDARRFLLMQHDGETPFAWLVCADDPELGFVVTNPWQFFPEYRPELEASHLRGVGADVAADLELLTIADVRGSEIHVNLAAPLLINASTHRGRQVILADEHPTRAPVRPLEAGDSGHASQP